MQKSEAIKAGLRMGFQDGSSKMARRKCYGFEIGPDGELTVNPDSELRTACEEIETMIDRTNKDILAQLGRKEQIRRCLNELRQHGDILDEFDLGLWNTLVESVTVFADRTLIFRFRDGTEIPVRLPEKK